MIFFLNAISGVLSVESQRRNIAATGADIKHHQNMYSTTSINEQRGQEIPTKVMKLCPNESAQEKTESVTLSKLPEELILAIYCLLPKKDALSLSSSCQSCHSVYKALPNHVHKHWFLQSLKLTPETTVCHVYPDSRKHDWKEARVNVDQLFQKLGQVKPPGCHIQKYLRWLQAEKANCAIIKKTLVGVSMLPNNFLDLFQESDPQGIFTERNWKVLNWMFPHNEEDRNVGHYFDYDKFLNLMNFVLEPEKSNKRLRQVMAEYHQISVRGGVGGRRFFHRDSNHHMHHGLHMRQIGALEALVQIGNPGREDDKIRYWAEIHW